ncbi:Thrombospondin type 3 repeat family [Cellvibrio japonicus Ueda107]|uniref:Thrombospondin type 3 repeat family n=2 Tax=Cellvibrio japonicus TaxID=155077 RepID=B3PL04_CELJU|nr:Thrombospondin type 3 repeat family [Cellvibrio japonicus Ueda107]
MLVPILSSASVQPSCDTVFPAALQSHKADGEITFDWNAQLLGNSQTALSVARVNNASWSPLPSCGSGPCNGSGGVTAAAGIAIDSGNSTQDYQVGYQGNATLGSSQQKSFRTINIGTNAQLTFSAISGAYQIKKLSLGYAATLNLAPGIYWIDQLLLASESKIHVVGNGTARLYVKGNVLFPYKAYANMQGSGQPLNAGRLFLYSQGNIELQTDAEVSALAYTHSRFALAQAKFYGATSFHQAYLGSSSKVIYQSLAVGNATLGEFCASNSSSSSSSSSSSVSSSAGANTSANHCRTVFSNGLQTHDPNGQIEFKYNAQLRSGSSTQLNTKAIVPGAGSTKPSCETAQCAATGVLGQKFQNLSFQASNSTTSVTVPWASSQTIGQNAQVNYDLISVSASAHLTLVPQSQAYNIRELSLAYAARADLPAGDYWIENLRLESDSQINVIGSGTVRLFVKNAIFLNWMAGINKNTNDASKLVIYAYNDVRLLSNSQVVGLVYSLGHGRLDYGANITGALSAANIVMETESSVVYRADAVNLADMGPICDEDEVPPDVTPPVLTLNPVPENTAQNVLTISGTVNDPVQAGSGIASVILKLATGEQRTAALNGNHYSVTIPLTLGLNAFVIEARDFANNLASLQASVKRISLPAIEFISPVDNSESTEASVSIKARIFTAWPIEQVSVRLDDQPQDLVTVAEGAYGFESALVSLLPGLNTIVVRAQTPDGEVEKTLRVVYQPLIDITPPQITVDPVSSPLDSTSVTLTGKAIDFGQPISGIATVTASIGTGSFYSAELSGDNFSVSVPLSLGDNIINLTATDHAGNQASVSIPVKRISLAAFSELIPADGTTVQQDSIIFSGVITTAWPIGSVQFYLNNASGSLSPIETGVYGFSVPNLSLQLGGNTLVLRAATPDGTIEQRIHITYEKPDRDGDGVPDDEDAFPDDPTEWSDLDGDGIGDNSDPDRDGDGISNDYESQLGTDPDDPASKPLDSDGDGIPDLLDDDRDGDGYNNDEDAFPDDPSEWSDMDGDGIGDNADPDRDGDGFTNEFEIERGTDPSDANDYPDTIAPLLSIANPDHQQVEVGEYVLEGTASDPVQPHSGIASVTVSNARFPGAVILANLDGESFLATVPLGVGENILTVRVQDLSGNYTDASHRVERIALPRFSHVAPVSGSVIGENKVTVSGNIQTAMPLEQVRFYLNEWQITPSGTEQPDLYQFVLPDVPLQLGSNTFILRAETPYGIDQQTLVLTYNPEDADSISAPDISLIAPLNNAQLRDNSFILKGRVVSHAGVVSVVINGQPAAITASGDNQYYFEKAITFEPEQSQLELLIAATDQLQKESQVTAHYFLDNSSPHIQLLGLSPAPTVNYLIQSPATIQGIVSDTNLASVTINDIPVRLTPTSTANSYAFNLPLQLQPSQETAWTIAAFDLGGNKTVVDYMFVSSAQVAIDALLPVSDAELLGIAGEMSLQVAARVNGLIDTGKVIVSIGDVSVELTRAGTLASGNISVPSQTGNYQIVYQALNENNEMVASASRNFSVRNEADIPLALLGHEPLNAEEHVEPNQPIELSFNKAIDIAKLTVKVYETLHGKTYINNDPAGLDFLDAKGYQLETVHRDRELVPGGLSLLPGGKLVGFYPTRQFGFNATLYVDVSYDGEEVGHFTFKVRKLPTFIIGGVVDQFGQPLAGITLNLPEIDRTVITNGDGGFAFGFQERPGEEIPGGRYKLQINPDFASREFGTLVRTINIQEGHKNEIPLIRLTELNPSAPFQLVSSFEGEASFIADQLRFDFSSTRLLFNKGRTSGSVQYQFLPFDQLGTSVAPGAWPQWMYAAQPRGVTVEGDVGITMTVPTLDGGHDYIPEVIRYVFIMGYNPEREVIEPIGIGEMVNHKVTSIGKITMQSLDFVGYAWVHPDHQERIKAVVDGQLSFQQLLGEIQQQN